MKPLKVAWISVMAALMAGCTGSSGSNGTSMIPTPEIPGANSAARPSGRKVTITMIGPSASNRLFAAARRGAEEAAKEQSKTTGSEISIDWHTPPTEDPEVQALLLAEAAKRGVDAIVVAPMDTSKISSAIDDAAAKGIFVMTFGSDLPKSKRAAYCGTDDAAIGTRLVSELAKQNEGKGTVAILAGSANSPANQRRVASIKDAVKKFPNMKIVGVVNHAENPNAAKTEFSKTMVANGQIDGWIMLGGWALEGTEPLDFGGKSPKIVAVDAQPEELQWIEKGVVPVMLAEPAYQWGHRTVELVIDKVVNRKDIKGAEKLEVVRVSKQNLGDWAVQLKDWGYENVEDKWLALSKLKPKAASKKEPAKPPR